MSENNNEKDLGSLLGIEKMSEVQKNETLQRVGGIIIESSIGVLLTSLGEEDVKKLEEYLKTVSEEDDVFAYLLRTYPDFQSIVEKEIAALHEQASDVFGK